MEYEFKEEKCFRCKAMFTPELTKEKDKVLAYCEECEWYEIRPLPPKKVSEEEAKQATKKRFNSRIVYRDEDEIHD